MLKHVYIDNYKCLVNFELDLGPQQLLLGLNGTGKSTLLEALTAVKRLVTGQAGPAVLFPEESHTRWESRPRQTFELKVELGASYRFRLELEPGEPPPRMRVSTEVVFCDNRLVFLFADGEVQLFNDEFEQQVTYPFDPFRSALATVQPRRDNRKLITFLRWMAKLHCLRLNPYAMSGRAESEDSAPESDMSNFASWYRHVYQERADSAAKLQEDLRRVIPDFESLDLRQFGGNVRTLEGRFTVPSSPPYEIQFGFEELSDGQRVLICLYALLHFLVQEGVCLFLDEPENYIALPEIQPWLVELRDRVDERGGQAILISHHPELINYLAPDIGVVFERTGSGPVRTRKYVADGELSLSPSEQIARGWSSNA